MPNIPGSDSVTSKTPLPATTTKPAFDDKVRPQTALGSASADDSLLLGQRTVDGSGATARVNAQAADILHLEKQYVSQCDHRARLTEKQTIFQQLEAIRSSIANPGDFHPCGGFAISFVSSTGEMVSVLPLDDKLDQQEQKLLLERLSLLIGESGETDESGELEKVFGKMGHKLDESLAQVQQAMAQTRGELERLAPGCDALNYQPEPARHYELSPVLPQWVKPEALKVPEHKERFVLIPIENKPAPMPEPLPPEKEPITAEPEPDTLEGVPEEEQHDGLLERLNQGRLFDSAVADDILQGNKLRFTRARPSCREVPHADVGRYDLASDGAADMLFYLESSEPEQIKALNEEIIHPLAISLAQRLREAEQTDFSDAQVVNMIYTGLFSTNIEQLDQDTDFTIVLRVNDSNWLINRRRSRHIRTLCFPGQHKGHPEMFELQPDNTDLAVAERLAKAIHQVDYVNPELQRDTSLLPAVAKLPSGSEFAGYHMVLEGSDPDPLMSDQEKLNFLRSRQGSEPKRVAEALQAELDRRAESRGSVTGAVVLTVAP